MQWLTSVVNNAHLFFSGLLVDESLSEHDSKLLVGYSFGISGRVIITLSPSVNINRVSPMRNLALSAILRGILTIRGGFLPDLAALIVTCSTLTFFPSVNFISENIVLYILVLPWISWNVFTN